LSGLSLNTLTIFSFCKTPELRTPCHLLVLSLALADSGISLNALIAATSSLLRVSHRRWPYGSDGCQAHGFQGFVTALASICSSAAIAWGRYHHYCTRGQLAWNSAISLVLFVWLSSTFWAALPLLGWGHYDYEPLGTCCTLDYSKGDRNFTSFLFTMSFFNFRHAPLHHDHILQSHGAETGEERSSPDTMSLRGGHINKVPPPALVITSTTMLSPSSVQPWRTGATLWKGEQEQAGQYHRQQVFSVHSDVRA
ncbi:hypothetical protein H8959_011368, partial [Pygathrix nigripes]